jgi:type I restriction enzyme M protein
MVVKPIDHKILDKGYLYYVLKYSDLKPIITGSAQPQITKQALLPFKIPLPTIVEQKKLVVELDKIQDSIKSAETLIKNLKTSGSSILNSFLTDKNNQIVSTTMGEIATFASRGTSPVYGTGNVRVIKSGQLRGFYEFDLSKEYFLEQEFKVGDKLLRKNDLLINSTGVGTAGRVGLFNLDGNFVADSHITIIRFNDDVISAYIMYFLAFYYGFDIIEKMATGSSGQIELRLSTIKNINIKLPNIKIQKEIVTKIEKEQTLIEPLTELILNLRLQMKTKIDELMSKNS